MKKRAIINFVASLLYQVISLVVGLILPKFYTETFGSVYNGLNQSVSQIMSLLSVLQFGVSAAAFQQMFQHIVSKDEKMISAIYWDTGRQYRKMGYIFLTAIIPITLVFPMLLEDELPYRIVVAFLALRAFSAALEYFFQAKYSVILIATNKSYAVYVINTLLLLIGTAFHLAVLFTTENILLYQAVAVATTLLRLVIVSTYIRRLYPYLYRYRKHSTPVLQASKRRDVMVSEIAGLVVDSTDMLLLSTFSGLVNTSIYSVYNFVTVGLGNVLSSCREAVFAGLGKTYYTDFEEFKKKFESFETVYLFLVFFLYAVAIVLFRPFVEVYTAKMNARYYYAGLPILFVVSRMIANLRIPSIVAVNTAGHFKEVKMYAVFDAIINLAVSLLLVKPFGIYGVLIGTIAGSLYRTPLIIRHANKHIVKRKQMDYWKKVLLWLPFFVGAYAVGEFVPIRCSSLLHWVVIALPVALAVLAAAVLWLLITDRKTLKQLYRIVRRKR